jgi:hypothetical protein
VRTAGERLIIRTDFSQNFARGRNVAWLAVM